jgi:hypothetical protein
VESSKRIEAFFWFVDWVLRIFGLFFLVGLSIRFTNDQSPPTVAVVAWIATAGFTAATLRQFRKLHLLLNAPTPEQLAEAKALGIDDLVYWRTTRQKLARYIANMKNMQARDKVNAERAKKAAATRKANKEKKLREAGEDKGA